MVRAPGSTLTEEDVIAYLDGKVAKWQLPKGVVWIDEVPKTSVGKFSKKTLPRRVRRRADERVTSTFPAIGRLHCRAMRH